MSVHAHPAARAGLAGPGRAGLELAGTRELTRLAFRRDRIMLPAWVYLITVTVVTNAYTFKKLYSAAAPRAQLVQSGGGNPALRFLYGQLNGSSVGALTAWRIGVWAALFGALMTTFIVVRHTRGDEEAGRLELVGSAAVGRQAALTAGLLTAVTANVTVSALLCVVLAAIGLPAAGSVAFALAIGASGLAFTGVAAVAAQLASGVRGARGICFGVLGAAFVLRAIGDSAGPSGPSWLSWTSPLGWVELTRPFDGQRWWVLALPCAVLAAGVGSAYALSARRDLGAGLLPDRPGPASAPALLRGPLSLAWRLQRGVLAGWAAGVAFIFATSGAAAKGIGSLLGSSTQLRNEFTRLGGQAAITNAYLAALMMLAGLGAAGYATSAVLRLRTEETGGLAEPLLATAVGRIRWGLSHLAVAVTGTAVLLALAGLAAGLGYGLRTGSPGPQAARMLGAAMAQLPASLVIAGVAVALVGLLPGASVAGAWTALGVVVVINLFGVALQLSHWLLDISPFTHAPKLPGGTVSAAPLLWLCLAALAFSAVGLAALRRRDIG
jgi:ABC-2 type transport system permease protein